jgi:hypothetical protein
MATKKLSLEEVIAKEMPGFCVSKEVAADSAAFEPDAVTPSLKTMQGKYYPQSSRKRTAKPDSNPASKSQLVVVESTTSSRSSDAPDKRFTVLVKDGKVRARQG